MYYLKDSQGNVVRALEWSSEQMTFVFRHDTRRVESCENVSYYDDRGIEYTVLDIVDRKIFAKAFSYPLKNLGGNLQIVIEAGQVLKNVELPQDDPKQFQIMLKKTSMVGGAVAALFFILSFFIHPAAPTPKEELQVVQVMDRKEIEKTIAKSVVVPPSPKRPAPVVPKTVPKKVVKHMITPHPKMVKVATQNTGVLGVLGSLKKSKQQGGLQLSQAEASAGIGRGGLEGSGGVQTAVYSKGMFSAPLGSGGKVNGAGGYGTRGKGGGKAGYGQVSLIGAGNSFFQPVESEAWVGGGLDRNEIAAVIQRHLSEVRYCYEQGLQNKPGLAGRLSMKFMIGPHGSVTLAQVQNSSLNHMPVENCIRDHLKTWNFPQPEGGVTVKVTYPFILRRVSDT
jgi:outer membrane biosynthesis protein TonB